MTLTTQLAEQLQIKGNRAWCLLGSCAHVQARLAAHTRGVGLDCLRPSSAHLQAFHSHLLQ